MMVKRTAQNLAEEERLKRRRLGGGRHREIDEEMEQQIAKAIEEKASYHGRRHEPTMFTHRYVCRKLCF